MQCSVRMRAGQAQRSEGGGRLARSYRRVHEGPQRPLHPPHATFTGQGRAHMGGGSGQSRGSFSLINSGKHFHQLSGGHDSAGSAARSVHAISHAYRTAFLPNGAAGARLLPSGVTNYNQLIFSSKKHKQKAPFAVGKTF